MQRHGGERVQEMREGDRRRKEGRAFGQKIMSMGEIRKLLSKKKAIFGILFTFEGKM